MTATIVFALLSTLVSAAQQSPPPACADVPDYQELDFWVGEWDVFVGDDKVGTNRIEKVLDGCAVMEHWTDAEGGEGKSLFYFNPREATWKQVWVTARAAALGGTKEKTLTEHLDDGAVRFQGALLTTDGRNILDRTTLTPQPDGSVRQHIEWSSDGGTTWSSSFEAVYRRQQSPSAVSTAPRQDIEAEALLAAERLSAQALDDGFPDEALATWMEQELGEGATATLEADDCGEQGGDGQQDRDRLPPLCVTFLLEHGDGQSVGISVVMGTWAEGLLGLPALHHAWVDGGRQTVFFASLAALADYLDGYTRPHGATTGCARSSVRTPFS